MSFISGLKCTQCNRTYNQGMYAKTCPNCNGVLKVIYNLQKVSEEISSTELEHREPGVWKYFEFLPIMNKSETVSLGEGGTFLHRCERLGSRIGLKDLYLKDETTNPTGAFIDRATTVEISKVKEFGFKSVCCGFTGNLAASVAAYAARAGFKCKVFLPQRVDLGKFYQVIAYGASIEVVEDREKAIERGIQESSISHSVMPYSPYFLEGHKTISYEICEQLNWTLPDQIIVPMGNGGVLSMIWKGINELHQMGFLRESKPRLVGVQAESCAPIVEAVRKNSREIKWASRGVSTIAIDISVKKPFCGHMALQAIRESRGTAIAVSDSEIVEAVGLMAELAGIFAEPASATTVAGLKKLVEKGEIDYSEKVVCVITGSGLKHPEVTRTLVKGKKRLEELLRGMERRKYSTKMGQTKMFVLKILSKGESYGYAIWKTLSDDFGVELKIPSVYQHLAELESAGLLIRSRSEQTLKKTKRKYYKLTEKGKTVLFQLEKLTT